MELKRSTKSGVAVLFLLLGLLAFSCKKTSSPVPPPVPPATGPVQISAISPMEGPGGTTVTIKGSGFSVSPGLDSVYFNDNAAVISYADDSILLVTVPPLAGTGNVSVKVNGTTITGSTFIYDYRGVVTTYAGSGAPDSANGNRMLASFNSPQGIAADANGNIYVADYRNKMIRMIDSYGMVSTLTHTNDNPWGIALDGKGSLYVSLYNNPAILKVSLSSGVTVPLSGNGTPGYQNSPPYSFAQFKQPMGLAVDQNDNVYVADGANNVIRVVTATGATTTFAGTQSTHGAQNGPAASATFWNPNGVVFDATGNLYVSDGGNYVIRKITPDLTVSTLAGQPGYGYFDGTDANATFGFPYAITIDNKGNLYVADYNWNSVRMITTAGEVVTIAGGNTGSVDGVGSAASFNAPLGIACDGKGNIYVADAGNNSIRKITLQ